MSTLKKITAVLFAILFISSAVPALVLFNLDRKGFTAETYQKAFANADFYNKLPVVMAEAMLSTSTEPVGFVTSAIRAVAPSAFIRYATKWLRVGIWEDSWRLCSRPPGSS